MDHEHKSNCDCPLHLLSKEERVEVIDAAIDQTNEDLKANGGRFPAGYFSDFSVTMTQYGTGSSGGMKARVKTDDGEVVHLPSNAIRKDTAANRAAMEAQATLMTKARRERLRAKRTFEG